VSSDNVDLKLIGAWDAYRKAIDPAEFAQRLQLYVGKAHERIGRQFQARAQRAIREKVYAPNSPITVILKRGQSTPLVGRPGGDLFQALSFSIPDPFRVRLGVIRQRAGDELVNVARILHEGATIDVAAHPNVRVAVWAKVREAMGRRAGTKKAASSRASALSSLALGSSGGPKNLWVIPPRPFILEPVADPKFGAFARAEWTDAARLAIFGTNKGHKGPHNEKG